MRRLESNPIYVYDKKRLSRLNEAESLSSDTILFFLRFAISDIRVVSGRKV